jgi:CHAD domain-containing protein
MHPRISPHQLLRGELKTFERRLSGVWDGDPEDVHDARVATRRIRELFTMLASPSGGDGELRDAFKQAGRSLGSVRELDVMEEHLRRMAAVFPPFAPLSATAATALSQLQGKQRRRMVEELEKLDLDRLLRAARRRAAKTPIRIPIRASWTSAMWDRIDRLAGRVREDLKQSSGIYIASRAHAARISVKKLRYAVEVAVGTRQWTPPHLLKDLKGVQGALGEVHDGQILLDRLHSLVDAGAAGSERLAEMESVLAAHIDRRYHRYLACRERLTAICDVCEQRAHHRSWLSWVAA